VGNDLVDLTDLEAKPGQFHRRFDQRVFGPSERAFIDASSDPNRARWALWTQKESAYKALKKTDREVRFIPRQFTAQLNRDQSGTVQFRQYHLRTATMTAPAWVHSVAIYTSPASVWSSGEPLYVEIDSHGGYRLRIPGEIAVARAAIRPLSEGVPQESSHLYARAVAREIAAAILGVDAQNIVIETRDRIPWISVNGEDRGVEISLSHHGGFVAATCAVSSL
jgi:phosphopantetheinyl transferase (holo-ACP synthase)